MMFNLVIVLASEDVEDHLHALKTITEQLSCVNGGTVFLENCIIVWKCYI
jgi:hypothetical protein